MFLQLLLLATLLHFGESQSQCVSAIQSLRTELRPQLRQDIQELVEDKATKSDIQELKQTLIAGQLVTDALASNVTKLIQELLSDGTRDAANDTVAENESQQCLRKDEIQAMIRSEVETIIRSEMKDILQTEVQAIIRGEIQSIVSYVTELQQNCSALEPETSVQASLLPVAMEVGSPGTKQHPVHSCKDIPKDSPSGYYWIQPNCGPAREQYCDMTSRRCCGSEGGWMRIANLNMTNVTQQCPPGFGLVNYPKRTCGRQGHGCASVVFPVHGVEYSRVCGRIIGYQYGDPHAFVTYPGHFHTYIDEAYVNGVSITYGTSPRNHIWSFAAAHGDKTGNFFKVCRCTRPHHPNETPFVHSFVGRDYFCETGSHSNVTERRFYPDDPLWDGLGCGEESTCCHHPRYFCKQLLQPITEDIELRLCSPGSYIYRDTPLELIELYVQ